MSKISCFIRLNLLITFCTEYANLSKLPNLSGSFIQQIVIEHLIFSHFCASPQAQFCFFSKLLTKKQHQLHRIATIVKYDNSFRLGSGLYIIT